MEFSFIETTTVGGSPVRIYTTIAESPYPVHGAYYSGKKYGWIPTAWKQNGRHTNVGPSKLDLVISFEDR